VPCTMAGFGIISVETSGSATREFILRVHKGHFQIYLFLILNQPSTLSEMTSPNLKAENVILCCLIRAITYFRGTDRSVSNNDGLINRRKSKNFGQELGPRLLRENESYIRSPGIQPGLCSEKPKTTNLK
jgi:hypothetical protein